MCKPSDQANLTSADFAAACRAKGWTPERIDAAWAFILKKAKAARAAEAQRWDDAFKSVYGRNP